MADVLIITVTYRSAPLMERWASAIEHSWDAAGRPGRLRGVVVENASGDAVLERLAEHPWIEVVELPENRGFAAGCNVALGRRKEDELAILMNPDVVVDEGFLAGALAVSWPEDLGIVGPRVIGADGAIEESARRFPSASTAAFGRTSLFSRLFPGSRGARQQLLSSGIDEPTDIDWVSGACMIVSPAMVRHVGLLDEGYFMYWEDADWCRRARDHGLRVRYDPRFHVVHHQGSSSAHRPYATTIQFHLSAWRYHRLHSARTPVHSAIAGAALGARAVLKLTAQAVRGRGRA